MSMDLLRRLLFPPKCVLCRKVLERNESDLCRACRVDSPRCGLDRRKFPFIDDWTAVWYYEGNPRGSILRYKFGKARYYAPSYGRALALAIEQQFPDGFDILTWVPISRMRKLRRGYDQARLLANAVGRELGIKPQKTLLKKRNNPPQSGIHGRAERRANVLGVYRAVNPEKFAGKRILLLDDVITTGATAGECARVLLTAGARQVILASLAAVRGDSQQK